MKSFFLPLLLAALCTASCKTDHFDDTRLPIDATLPLADFNITDSMLFAWGGIGEYISKNDEGVLEVESAIDFTVGNAENLREIFTLEDQQFVFHYDLSSAGISPGTVSLPDGLGFEARFRFAGNARLRKAVLSSGTFGLNVGNTRLDFSRIVCTVPQLTKEGRPLQIRPGESVSVAGYTLAFDKEEAMLSFQLSGSIEIAPEDDLSDITLSARLTGLTIREAEGFLGRWEIDPGQENKGSFSSGVTEFYKDCRYYLADPQLTLRIDNGFDVPALVLISRFTVGGREIALKDKIGGSRIFLSPGKITEYTLSNAATIQGTALSDVLSTDISGYSIGFRIIINPTAEDVGDPGYLPPENNKISSEADISAGAVLHIPLYGYFEDLSFTEKIKFGDLNPPEDSRYEYLLLAVTCENELPLGLDFSLSAVSEDGTETELLTEPVRIPSSNGFKPQDSGFIPGKTEESNAVIYKIQGDNVKAFLEARDLILKFKGSTYEAGKGYNVKFYSPANLKLRLIANIKGEI